MFLSGSSVLHTEGRQQDEASVDFRGMVPWHAYQESLSISSDVS